ncbi:LuxR C-terminal-related transcriptional regulator [Gordonia jinhuaensis]|uniref:LuxR C-terminal-related transcriptional regulator n=1 Tax=Gordonia jinhuaensis TaxID=1517702 RepID=UPI001669D4A1|nr:LuxR family transcriptional regulator [Gordonia jinhuaensis]
MPRAWPFVGRDVELDRIVHTVLRTRRPVAPSNPEPTGIPTTTGGVLLSGESGLGKTRLATELVRIAAHRGFRTHWLTATDAIRDVPLAVFARFTPIQSTPARFVTTPADPLQRITSLIDAVTADACRRRMVIGIDDVHLLDDQSAFVAGELMTRGIATLVLTVRTGEVLPGPLDALWRQGALQRCELTPVGPPEVRTILEEAVGGPVDSYTVQRFSAMSGGNHLLLRQLVEGELTSGRLAPVTGVWTWTGHLTVSPTIRDVMRSRLEKVDDSVAELIDLLALAEPLPQQLLVDLGYRTQLEHAEDHGIVVVRTDGDRELVGFAHPLIGEIRKSGIATLRARRLHRIAGTALLDATDESDFVRAVVHLLQSDITPSVAEIFDAVRTATQIGAPDVAHRIAMAGIAHPEIGDRLLEMVTTLTALGYGDEVAAVIADTDDDIVKSTPMWDILRAANLTWNLGEAVESLRVLDAIDLSATTADQRLHRHALAAIRAGTLSVLTRPQSALESLARVRFDELPDYHALIASAAQVSAYGSLGDHAAAGRAAASGFAILARAWQTAHLRPWFTAVWARAARLAGDIDTCITDATALQEISRGHTMPSTLGADFQMGHALLAGGQPEAAIGALTDVLAALSRYQGITTGIRPAVLIWLTEAYALAGQPVRARVTLTELERVMPPDFAFMSSGQALATAWTLAAEGQLSAASRIASDAAELARAHGLPSHEVNALQVLVQFGDPRPRERLNELASTVGGPRVVAAACHAEALASGDGNRLLVAAQRYSDMGDRIAAADALAAAVAAFHRAELHGSEMSTRERLAHLLADCGPIDTPAIRATDIGVEFTRRQHEIIELIGQGLTNKEIAQQLSLSVRSVEGHIYRATQRAAVTSREELATLIRRPGADRS